MVTGNVDKLYELVQKGRIKQVLAELADFTKNKDAEAHAEVIELTGKFNILNKKIRRQIIADGDADVARAKILSSVMEIISDTAQD